VLVYVSIGCLTIDDLMYYLMAEVGFACCSMYDYCCTL